MPLSERVYCVATALEMTERVEQWICIKFCVKLELFVHGNYSDDSEGFQGQCNECSTNKSVAQKLQRWLKIWWKWSTFWNACDKQNTRECWKCMCCNEKRWRLTGWELEANLWIPRTTASEILMQGLGMKHVMTKFVPLLLLPEQKEHCAAVANDLIQTTTNEPDCLKKVISLKGTQASLFLVSCLFFSNVSIFHSMCWILPGQTLYI